MEAHSIRGNGRAGVGHNVRGGREYIRGRGSDRGRGGSWRGRGRGIGGIIGVGGEDWGQSHRGRGGEIVSGGGGYRGYNNRGRGRENGPSGGDWGCSHRGRGLENGPGGRDWGYSHRGRGRKNGPGGGDWRYSHKGRGGEISLDGGDCWRYSNRGRGRGNSPGRGDRGCSYRGYGKQYRNGKKSIPEDELDPLKLFVGNLTLNVNKDQLLETLSPHANITSAVIVQKKFLGPNYGFLSLPTEADVEKIMDLNNQNFYLSGNKLIFRPTRRRFIPPGDEGFVRQSLPCRDYDFSPLDPARPSIHVLVDDVIMKILEYLPLKERIICELVCRRWQALLYVMFENLHLDLSEVYLIRDSLSVSKAMLSKMMLLTGENLRGLCLSETDDTLSESKLFPIISQLCPNLEYLELSNNPRLCFDNVKVLKECNKLKWFAANKCSKLDEDSFKDLISVLPCLEIIYVCSTDINGNCFNLLPKGLKELNIGFCNKVTIRNLRKVSKTCRNLEMLDIECINTNKAFLEELAVNCKNLKNLKFWHFEDNVEVSNQIKLFTKLKSLKMREYTTLELYSIADNLMDLEEIQIQIYEETTNMIDFGKFKKLKSAILFSSPFRKQELMSLEKCKNLQYAIIVDCNADQEIIKKIVKGCPEIKHIKCSKVGIDIKFINEINEIMKYRSEPIKITVDEGALTSSEYLKAQYDTNKIKFHFVEYSLSDEDSDDALSDDSDDMFYDSDDLFYDYDDMDHFWFNGYDTDDSLPDYMFYGDNFNLDFLIIG